MKIITLFFLTLLFESNALANDFDQKLQELMRNPVNCNAKFPDSQTDPVTLLYWDGDCKNGFIEGSGMMLYKRQSNNFPGRYIGQFKEGTMEKGTIWMLTIMTNDGKTNDFITHILNNSTTLYATWDSNPFASDLKSNKNWNKNINYLAGADNSKYSQISYEDLLKNLESDFSRLKPTMSFYKFKSYLDNPWNDGWSNPIPRNTGSSRLEDDPPVKGITLSLGGEVKPKKKSKKKN